MIAQYIKLHLDLCKQLHYVFSSYLLTSKDLFLNVFPTVVSCEVPHITNGGHNRRNGVTFGETVTFHCNDGYRLLGEGSARCLQDSHLFPNIPSCEGEYVESF